MRQTSRCGWLGDPASDRRVQPWFSAALIWRGDACDLELAAIAVLLLWRSGVECVVSARGEPDVLRLLGAVPALSHGSR